MGGGEQNSSLGPPVQAQTQTTDPHWSTTIIQEQTSGLPVRPCHSKSKVQPPGILTVLGRPPADHAPYKSTVPHPSSWPSEVKMHIYWWICRWPFSPPCAWVMSSGHSPLQHAELMIICEWDVHTLWTYGVISFLSEWWLGQHESMSLKPRFESLSLRSVSVDGLMTCSGLLMFISQKHCFMFRSSTTIQWPWTPWSLMYGTLVWWLNKQRLLSDLLEYRGQQK